MKVATPHAKVLVWVSPHVPQRSAVPKASTLKTTGAHYIVSDDYVTVQECLKSFEGDKTKRSFNLFLRNLGKLKLYV